jgi:hypothetical protein
MFRTPSRNADPPSGSANSGQDANDEDTPLSSSEDEIPDPAEALNLSLRPVRVAVVPQKFNGLRDEDPQIWVQNFDRAADSNG